MSVDLDTLGACPGFRWMKQMREVDGAVCLDVSSSGRPYLWWVNGELSYADPDDAARLDLDDPATCGCLLTQVREKYGHGPTRDVNIERLHNGRYSLAVRVWDVNPEAWVYDVNIHGGWMGGARWRPHGCVSALDQDTYGLALAAALLAAPTKGDGR